MPGPTLAQTRMETPCLPLTSAVETVLNWAELSTTQRLAVLAAMQEDAGQLVATRMSHYAEVAARAAGGTAASSARPPVPPEPGATEGEPGGGAEEQTRTLTKAFLDAPRPAATVATASPREQGTLSPAEVHTAEAATTRPPWYTEHGMLGEVQVNGVARWRREEAAQKAEAIIGDLGSRLTPNARSAVRAALTSLLAGDDPHEWDELLNTGRVFAADGQVVWLRPVLADVQELPVVHEAPADAIRSYTVRWSSTVAHSFASNHSSHAAETFLFTLLDVGSAVASAMVLGLPQLSMDAGRFERIDQRDNLISGRKLFVGNTVGFTTGVRIRIYVNGVELTPSSAHVPDRGLVVGFPAEFTGGDEPRFDTLTSADSTAMAAPAGDFGPSEQEHGQVVRKGRIRRGGEVLNAVDMDPVITGLQRHLLRERAFDAEAVAAFTTQALRHLNERTVRLRSTLLMTSGDSTGTISIRGVRGNGFLGHLRLRLEPARARLVAVSDSVKIRDDLGGGHAHGLSEGGSSSASVTFSTSAVGLAAPNAGVPDHHRLATGLAPLASLSVTLGRRWQHSTTDQTLSHTIVTTTEARARYHALFKVAVEFVPDAGSAPSPLDVHVHADLGLPWRDGEGAADFERRLLGAVTSPYVATHRKGRASADAPRTGPVPLQPFADVPETARAGEAMNVVPPPRLLRRPEEQPWPRSEDHGELTGRSRLDAANPPLTSFVRPEDMPVPPPEEPVPDGGLGFASASALPGAELITDFFRERLSTVARTTGTNWTAVDRSLMSHFSRPALEGAAQDLRAGVVADVPVGERTFRLAVRGYLLAAAGDGRESESTIDTRAATTTVSMGSRDRHWKVSVSVGGGARLSILNWFKLRLGGLRAGAAIEGGSGTGFTSSTSAYRRKGSETGSVESVHDIAYELSLLSTDDGPRVEERVWLHLPDELVAELLTPQQDAPLPRIASDPQAGQFSLLRKWPSPGSGTALDFSRGTTGLYPTFSFVHRLQFFAASQYYRVLNQPWTAHFATWPKEIIDTFKPSELAAHFGRLTSPTGHTVQLPVTDGWSTTLTLRMTAQRPRLLASVDDGTELEHYLRSLNRSSKDSSRKYSVTADAVLGVQGSLGSEAGAHGSEESHSAVGGRVIASGHGGVGRHWGSGEQTDTGSIEISRGTYSGVIHTYRLDPVFQVSLTATKGKTSRSVVRYIRLNSAMELKVPDRRVEDLFPQANELSTHPVDVVRGAREPVRAYPDGRLPRTLGWPEALTADDVLPEIFRRLRQRGVLAPADRPGTKQQQRVMRLLTAQFHADELQSNLPTLLDQGVHAWIPVSGMLGATQYLSVRVAIEHIARAHSQRDRPDLRLTLRGESLDEHHSSQSESTGWSAGVGLSGRAGTHTQPDEEHGKHLATARHGGVDLAAGRFGELIRSEKVSSKTVGIYRASTTRKDPGREFEHRVRFRIDMHLVRELPQVLESVRRTVPNALSSAFGSVLGLVTSGTSGDVAFRPPSRLPKLLWRDDGGTSLVEGDLRYIVPEHFTVARNTLRFRQDETPFIRAYGSAARWETTAHRPPGPEVVRELHPWDVPAAGAVQRWAKVAALGRRARPDLTQDGVWNIPGLDDTTTDGIAYEKATREAYLRPRLAELLLNRHKLSVGAGTVTVGLHIKAARPLANVGEPSMKQRRYTQTDEEHESGHERRSGTFLAGGPDGRGTADDALLLNRNAWVFEHAREEGSGGSAYETEETNREGTRTWRYYVFDVTVSFGTGAADTSLSVDVPQGLYGMLPLEADGHHAEGIRAWLTSLETALVPPVRSLAERPPSARPPAVTRPAPATAARRGARAAVPPRLESVPEEADPATSTTSHAASHPGMRAEEPPGTSAAHPEQAARVFLDTPPPAPAAEVTTRNVLRSAAALAASVDTAIAVVAAESGPGETALAQPSLLNCGTLLEALLKQLYPARNHSARFGRSSAPAAVFAARTLDDLATGRRDAEQRLARGPGWSRVVSWETLTDAVTQAGPGATGLVIVRRRRGAGHAFALHHTTDGVRWIELQGPRGRRVTEQPPSWLSPHAGQGTVPSVVPRAEQAARAVVIDRDGRVLAHALDSQGAGTPRTADALTDPPVEPGLIGGIAVHADAAGVRRGLDHDRKPPWRPLPGTALPTQVIRHVQRFDITALTRLDSKKLSAVDLGNVAGDTYWRRTVREVTAIASGNILARMERSGPAVTLTNADIVITVPDEGPLQLWLMVIQQVANRLDHRVTVVLTTANAKTFEICPQQRLRTNRRPLPPR
ncbi:hypothetical protein GCM10010129_78570 [Streptomyces fumigatiscleroticus]|nr:hypothetical protein GCM10010129_78570 [Streptomyces fumigatiscleroticus]